jgi:uncharacterized protein (TIGR03083 family)
MSEPQATAYRELRLRVTEVLATADAFALAGAAPATPGWSVHDLVAHLVGVPDDVVNGRMDGLASDAWTQAQVDKRADLPTAALVAEWEETGPAFEALLAASPVEIAGQALFDAASHEHDLRHAIGAPGARESDAVAEAWEWVANARTRNGEHALCFVIDGYEQLSGTGEVVARIEAPRFELFRAVSGRRAAAEIEQYKWDREPEPTLLLAADLFTLRDAPLDE